MKSHEHKRHLTEDLGGIEKFNPNKYFYLSRDPNLLSDKLNLIATPTLEGGKLVADYYKEKYHTQIYLTDACYNDSTFLNAIKKNIHVARRSSSDYRHAFLIGFGLAHTRVIVYIKEGQKEGILYSNSLGTEKNSYDEEIIKFLSAELKIKIFFTKELRQVDSVSCHIDGILFARNATGKIPGTDSYKAPGLLAHLENHCSESKDQHTSSTFLPDVLLISAQHRKFVALHTQNNEHPPVHGTENLAQIRTRYTVPNVEYIRTDLQHIGEKAKGSVLIYLHKKSLKLANIMQIQDYWREVVSVAPWLESRDLKTLFVTQAKAKLKAVTEEELKLEPRLDSFTWKFLVTHNKKFNKGVFYKSGNKNLTFSNQPKQKPQLPDAPRSCCNIM